MSGDGPYLIDTEGNRSIDGVSSLWCNIHGHRVPEIDDAIRRQLDRIAHSTLLGLASPPSIELAARLAELAPGELSRVFYSDAGATALEDILRQQADETAAIVLEPLVQGASGIICQPPARLRITPMATHTREEVDDLSAALTRLLPLAVGPSQQAEHPAASEPIFAA